MEDSAVIKNLQEQLQCSEKERTEALELWQTAVEQLNTIQQSYERTVVDEHNHDAQMQQLKVPRSAITKLNSLTCTDTHLYIYMARATEGICSSLNSC